MRGCVVLKSVKPFNKKPSVFSIGGFSFKTPDGKEFGFDWEESCTYTEVKDGYLITESDLKNLDEGTFGEEIQEILGMSIWDITPEFLTSCKITEVYYECFADQEEHEFIDLELVEFSFERYDIDTDTSTEGKFSAEAIADFNLMEAICRGDAITSFFKEE